jgi:hypothetical protein
MVVSTPQKVGFADFADRGAVIRMIDEASMAATEAVIRRSWMGQVKEPEFLFGNPSPNLVVQSSL